MKRKYYLEICSSSKISGGVYYLGEYTEKQALKECKKRIKALWRSDKKNFESLRYNLCTDEDALDLVYEIMLFRGDICVYDYRTEEYIEDTRQERIDKIKKDLDESLAMMEHYANKIIESRNEKNDSGL